MSRVGKKPIPLPADIKYTYKDHFVSIQGSKGELKREIHPAVDLKKEDGAIIVITMKDDRNSRALQGLVRSLVANMIIGVSRGFERTLQINGIGYRALLEGNRIVFNLGYSHLINFELPDGVTALIEKNNVIKLTSIDNEKLGQTAAAIRRLRPPEPYKGKGIKYAEEYIQRKAGKTGAK